MGICCFGGLCIYFCARLFVCVDIFMSVSVYVFISCISGVVNMNACECLYYRNHSLETRIFALWCSISFQNCIPLLENCIKSMTKPSNLTLVPDSVVLVFI